MFIWKHLKIVYISISNIFFYSANASLQDSSLADGSVGDHSYLSATEELPSEGEQGDGIPLPKVVRGYWEPFYCLYIFIFQGTCKKDLCLSIIWTHIIEISDIFNCKYVGMPINWIINAQISVKLFDSHYFELCIDNYYLHHGYS